MATPLYKDCDHRLRLRKVKNAEKELVNDGTVTYELIRISDNEVMDAGSVPAIGADGNYWVTIDKLITADVEEDEEYVIKVVFGDPDGDDSTWYLDLFGALRRR